jgi:hypothetical protein
MPFCPTKIGKFRAAPRKYNSARQTIFLGAESKSQMNETQPNRSDWPAAVGLVFLFTIIGAIPLLLLAGYLYLNSPSTKPPLPVTICTFIPGFLFGLWYARKLLNKERWRLTETKLICGSSVQQVFPLASIEKVIVGLPTIGGTNALLLCFDDGARLPLRLYALPNGSAVMAELQKKLSDRLVRDYDYSTEEIRLLRTADINELIPARN